MKALWFILIIPLLILNLLPLGGLLRGFPVVSSGQIVPLGSFFEGIPLLYNKDILNGGIFETMVIGGQRFLQGENVYDLKEIGAGPFLYPPFVVMVGIVFSFISSPYNYWVWLVINILLLVSILYYIRRILPPEYSSYFPYICLGFLLSTPLLRQLAWGHYIILMMFFFVVLFYYRTYWIHSGVAFGLLCSVSFYGFLVLPYFFMKRQFKALFLGVGVFVMSHIVLLLNKASLVGYLDLIPRLNALGLSHRGFFSVVNFISSLSHVFSTFFAVLVGCFFLYLTYLLYRTPSSSSTTLSSSTDSLFFSLVVVTLLILDPWLSEHHLPLLLLVYVFLIGQKLWKIVLPVLYVLTDVHYDFFQEFSWLEYSWFTYVRYIGVLCAFVYVIYLIKFKKSKNDTLAHTTQV